MKMFFKKHPEFSREDVIEATKRYVESKEIESWAYMKTATHFIEKDKSSLLASIIEEGADEPDQDTSLYTEDV